MRTTQSSYTLARLSEPVLHPYTIELRKSMDRYNMPIRGKNGICDQTRLDPRSVEEIVAGRAPSMEEHKALCRCFAVLKHQHNSLILWHKKLEAEREAEEHQERLATRSRSRNFVEVEIGDTPRPRQIVLDAPKVEAASSDLAKAPTIKPAASTESASGSGRDSLVSAPILVPKTFGEWLRACREREKLKPEELGEMVGVVRGAVDHWEADSVTPVRENYDKLLQIFPELKSAPKPKTRVRDIAVPRGNQDNHGPRGSRPDVEVFAVASESPATVGAETPIAADVTAVPMALADSDSLVSSALSLPSKPAAPPSLSPHKALIKFGIELEKLRTLPIETRKKIADVVSLGAAAGVSLPEVLAMLIEEG